MRQELFVGHSGGIWLSGSDDGHGRACGEGLRECGHCGVWNVVPKDVRRRGALMPRCTSGLGLQCGDIRALNIYHSNNQPKDHAADDHKTYGLGVGKSREQRVVIKDRVHQSVSRTGFPAY